MGCTPPCVGAAIDESPPGGAAVQRLLPGGTVPSAAQLGRAASGASTRVLEKKPSRERSPHRDGLQPPSSSAFASPSLKVAPEAAADDGGFAAGQSALLLGLSSRPELVGQLVTLRSFDATSARWAVTVASSGESIKVRSQCLKPSIFG